MEEENAPTPKKQDRTTLKDVGKGLILLGAGILLLTAIFLIMAILENEYYELFAGEAHLAFNTVMGLALVGIGFFLVKRLKQPSSE